MGPEGTLTPHINPCPVSQLHRGDGPGGQCAPGVSGSLTPGTREQQKWQGRILPRSDPETPSAVSGGLGLPPRQGPPPDTGPTRSLCAWWGQCGPRSALPSP